MDRVVVVVQKMINGPSQVFLAERDDLIDADRPAVLQTAGAQAILDKINAAQLAPNAIKEIGAELIEMLAAHPAIKDSVVPFLDQKIQTPGPIYLLMKDPDLELLPWEALYTPNAGFVSCDPRWPVARAQKVPPKKPESVFVPPLKIMAILGASGGDALTRIPADEEWAALYASLRSSTLNIRLKVLVCQEDLKAKIDAEKKDWIEAALLATEDEEGNDLFKIIHEFSPHLLHFFCHGDANPFPRLEVGTALDWERKQPGSIPIEGRQLHDRADPEGNTWLVTLNCCESALQGEVRGSRSVPIASALVTAGFPAVVGMRERVESDLAHAFCRLFYEGLLTDLTQRIESAGSETVKEIHWACGLYAARQKICERVVQGAPFTESAASLKEWTIPILFTRLHPFRLKVVSDQNGLNPVFRPEPAQPNAAAAPPAAEPGLTQKKIHDLAEEMEQLIADRDRFKNLPPVVRKKIDARLADIEAQLNA